MKSLHVNKGKSIAQTLADRTDYADNPEKTKNGELVTGFGCDPFVADEQFLLAKKEYEYITGRNQGAHNVLAYHIRQSFKPGEVSPEEANEIGRELAERFFKGKHAFIVATHIDKAHVHNHIIVNSTTLDCTHKFRDFIRSGRAVRRLSDLLCAEHGLSVIENPKPSRGSYADWLDNKPPSWSEQIKRKVDEFLPSCATFEDFIAMLRAEGCAVRTGKHTSVKLPGQKRPIRFDTLKGEYTEAAIRERLDQYAADRKRGVRASGTGGASSEIGGKVYQPATGSFSLLIDIQAKIREGKGAGYEQWAKVFNLKQAAKTLIFLQENGIDSYEDLKKKASSASGGFSALNQKIRDVETRMNEITELQKIIGQYGKTREVYAAYKKSGWGRKFYDEHTADIILHRAAKKHFDELGMKKLPSITSLKQEYAALAAEKKKLYTDYREKKDNSRALITALGNANHILGIKPETQKRDASIETPRRNTPEI